MPKVAGASEECIIQPTGKEEEEENIRIQCIFYFFRIFTETAALATDCHPFLLLSILLPPLTLYFTIYLWPPWSDQALGVERPPETSQEPPSRKWNWGRRRRKITVRWTQTHIQFSIWAVINCTTAECWAESFELLFLLFGLALHKSARMNQERTIDPFILSLVTTIWLSVFSV